MVEPKALGCRVKDTGSEAKLGFSKKAHVFDFAKLAIVF